MQQQVAHDEAAAREAVSPPVRNSESWEQLQSAHAHMLLLEARLAELAKTPEDTLVAVQV